MYETRFGLKFRPFRPTPDPTAYYPATSHESALARIVEAIRGDEGLVLLIGEPGTGKTLVCHCVVERLGPAVNCVFLTDGRFASRLGLLQAVAYDSGLPYEGRPEQELRLAITDLLLKRYSSAQRSVMLFDEAQHLAPELLEELRLLGNLESRHGKAVQVILSAQPGLVETLKRPELTGFRQRLTVRVRLEPLALQEAMDYVVHQVRAAGGKPEHLFTEEALEVLARGGRGIPRLLNQAAGQALFLAYADGASVVDAEAAIEALDSLGLAADSIATGEQPLGNSGGEEGAAGVGAEVGPVDDDLFEEAIEPPHNPAEVKKNGNQPPPLFDPARRPA